MGARSASRSDRGARNACCGISARASGSRARADGLLDEEVVRVAVTPALAGFEGADDRMRRRAEVLRGVLVRRVVAAADVSAFEAQPKVDPLIPGREALLAPLWRVWPMITRSTEVSTKSLGHVASVRSEARGVRPLSGQAGSAWGVGCWNRRTGERSRYRKARAAITAEAKSVVRNPTRSPTMPAPNAAGGATAKATKRVAEFTRPRRCSGVSACVRLTELTTQSGTVRPRSACDRPSTMAPCSGVPPAKGRSSRLNVSSRSEAII